MTLASGSRLGPYEITGTLGAGGMGEVYRARDTRLERSVAIKVLPAELAQNAQFRSRFEREAKTISSLNHPNICTLHDFGHDNGVDYLVMELVEGESLADRIERGPLPPADVLRYGGQIAEALDRAHRAGIVHRDLKPGNIMLTKHGAKLLDFGLAKNAVTAMSPESATIQKSLTAEGTIIGTFQYMAPEQLEGMEADPRTDIFALGAVLYEMASGRRAFDGKTRTSLIAAIVSSQPTPIAELQPLAPPALDHVIERCLAKDPADRWQSAKDVAEELKWISEKGSQVGVAAPLAMRRKTRERLAWTLSSLLAVATMVFASLWLLLQRQPHPRLESSILPPEKVQFAFDNGSLVISPDGARVAYAGRGTDNRAALWIRPLNAGSSQMLAGTEGASYPFWSADSRFVGFFAGGKLKKIDANGGPPQTLCDAGNGRGGSWGRDGTIVFAPTDRDPLSRVPSSGGQATAVTQLSNEEFSHRFPWLLPDGKHFLFLAQSLKSTQDRGRIMVGQLDSKEVKSLLSANSPVVYSTAGYVLFCRERSLLAQRFDPEKLLLSEEPFPIAEKIQTFANTASAIFSVATNGMLVYQTGSAGVISQLGWLDRAGKPLGVIGTPADYYRPRLSHDGKRIAVEIVDEQIGTSDLYIYDLVRNTPTRLTFEPSPDTGAVWSPDDQFIAYSSDQPGQAFRSIMKMKSSGAGSAQLVASSDSPNLATTDWSRDGR
ncbi:MAG: protein kinase, partial [Thermoanaerobaculia bacterium]